jgi:hypothetical protein
MRLRKLWLVGLLGMLGTPASAAPPPPSEIDPGEGDALLEFHFSPVDNLQIAIWLEDDEGNFLEDVFVTQATGKLGIGNRPGLPLFLSSWRAPYGPRETVLPVWAHRRGKTYPKIVFHDPNPNHDTSLGFHEASSSAESYFCRPLTPEEDDKLLTMDVMTCPSPAVFRTDKGEFRDALAPSVYPPRNDLTNFDEDHDAEEIKTYAELNDLDAVTRATPMPGSYVLAHRILRDDVPPGPLVAWIEVSLERDENPDWEFDRVEDHWVDPSLASYGREFLGQPAILYRVEFDPGVEGYTVVSEYAGYADWTGATGTLNPPDATISQSGGSGADRLQIHNQFGQTGRFGVYSHGWGWGGGDSGGDTGGCYDGTLPPVEDLHLAPVDFDRVRATFRLPELPADVELANLYAHWITPETTDFQLSAAKEAPGIPRFCSAPDELDCLVAGPGDEVSVEITQLFGNYTYTVGISYDDSCTNESEVAFADVTTPVQKFQTIDTHCFIATAAWGAGWTEELRALRWFRDQVMLEQPNVPIMRDLVTYYYAYGPVLAEMIHDVPPARAAARLLLRPVVRIAQAVVTSKGA